jgi:hypothetical protein
MSSSGECRVFRSVERPCVRSKQTKSEFAEPPTIDRTPRTAIDRTPRTPIDRAQSQRTRTHQWVGMLMGGLPPVFLALSGPPSGGRSVFWWWVGRPASVGSRCTKGGPCLGGHRFSCSVKRLLGLLRLSPSAPSSWCPPLLASIYLGTPSRSVCGYGLR